MVKSEVKKGLRVIITSVDAHPRLLVAAPYLTARREKAVGKVTGPIPQHDGAWWVQHERGIAAYWFHEFEPVQGQMDSQDEWEIIPFED